MTVYITVCLLIFVFVISAAFSLLFYQNSRSAFEKNMHSIAAGIGEMISATAQKRGSFSIGATDQEKSEEDGAQEQTGFPFTNPRVEDDPLRPDGEIRLGIPVFSKLISKLTNATVWLIAPDATGGSYDMLFMMRNDKYTDTDFDHLGESQRSFITGIFDGNSDDTKVFGSLFSESTISVGEPIYGKNGAVIGAVVLHSSSSGIFDDMKGALITMSASLVAAMIVGFITAMKASRSFTKPLLKINDAATMISEGDYTARTDVRSSDEIGVLAETIDEMSEKLSAASEESEKLQKLRQDFIANISHELRTPVTVMRGSLEALCDGVVTEPDLVEQYHSEMLKESKYMQRMVNDLLDLSRLQNPDFSMNINDFNLFDCISDAVRMAKRIADPANKTVEPEYDAAEIPFRGDYDRVRQMLLIVLDNAVKFTEDAANPIKVGLKNRTVTVTNTGKGIDAEEIPFIFDRFYRSRSETNKNGTGLGLAIAKQIAVRHGIGISVRSVPGGETTFIFDFTGGGVE